MLIKEIKYFFKSVRLSYIIFMEYSAIESYESQLKLKKCIIQFRKIQACILSVNKSNHYDLQLQSCKVMINTFNRLFPKEYTMWKTLDNILITKEIELATI